MLERRAGDPWSQRANGGEEGTLRTAGPAPLTPSAGPRA